MTKAFTPEHKYKIANSIDSEWEKVKKEIIELFDANI